MCFTYESHGRQAESTKMARQRRKIEWTDGADVMRKTKLDVFEGF
jgi:hypothetical protein